MSIVVRSKSTGQVLFTVSLLEGELRVSPSEARRLLVTPGGSAIDRFVEITSAETKRSTLIARMFGATASRPDADLEPMNFHPQIRKRVII